jgi:cysteine-rich repeat protein
VIRIPTRASAFRPLAGALVLAALCTGLLPDPAHAHGPPTPLNFWGAFGRRVGRCQRIIGRAAALCALRAWDARRECMLTTMQGGTCDEDATDAAIEAARLDAVDTVDDGCTDQQALMLVFLGRFEAEQDVIRFCRQLEDAAASAVFRPLAGDAPASPLVRRCVASAALATTKLLRRSFDARQQLLDRIAVGSFAPARKQAMLAESTTAIGSHAAALRLTTAATCSDGDFTAVYGRDTPTFLSLIASRADCLAGTTYAQGGVVCPSPVCGNGMLEGDALREEECDDGNLTPGDGCSATCAHE